MKSWEGTTQGEPLAMPLYTMATIPLIKELSSKADTTQIWYADDTVAVGTIANIYTWWESLISHGPACGHYANKAKIRLIVKKEVELKAPIFSRAGGLISPPPGADPGINYEGHAGGCTGV